MEVERRGHAADEIGLAVLATTMAIVAVFLPVALMPGLAGQYFKAFGFTVVLSVLMSLFVARMITPLIAAYFLRSHGVQPHAAWKWMDVYLKVLNWSLDTTKAHALLERQDVLAGRLLDEAGRRIEAERFGHVLDARQVVQIPQPESNQEFLRRPIEERPADDVLAADDLDQVPLEQRERGAGGAVLPAAEGAFGVKHDRRPVVRVWVPQTLQPYATC